MYGIINQAVKDLICAQGGQELWIRVCEDAGIGLQEFDALEPYSDDVTFALVAAASKHLGVPETEVLRQFGHHWILFTAAQGYGEIMNMFGRDFRSCLKNLNRMHGHMGAMMPHLRPPRFVVDECSDDRFVLHYYSDRVGLGKLVVGLLEGLAQKYQERICIDYIDREECSDHEQFEITLLGT